MGRMQAVLHDISLYNHEISLSFTVPFHGAISLCVAMDTGLPPSHPRTIRRTCVLMLDSDVCHRFWSPRQESPGRSRPAMEPRFEHHRLREHRLALTGVGAGRVEGWPVLAPVVRTPGGLAVQGHSPTVQALHSPCEPVSNCFGSRRARTCPLVSWAGIPCSRHSHGSIQAR